MDRKLSKILEKCRDDVGHPEGFEEFDYYSAMAKILEFECDRYRAKYEQVRYEFEALQKELNK